jgi:hypothetical protein
MTAEFFVDHRHCAESTYPSARNSRRSTFPVAVIGRVSMAFDRWLDANVPASQIRAMFSAKREAELIDLSKYTQDIEAEIKQLRENIAPLEYRGHKIGTRTPTGEWQDITATVIARNKKSIATYEAILQAIRGKGSL